MLQKKQIVEEGYWDYAKNIPGTPGYEEYGGV